MAFASIDITIAFHYLIYVDINTKDDIIYIHA